MQKNNAAISNRRRESLLRLLMVWGYRIVLLLVMAAGICRLDALPIRWIPRNCVVVMGAYIVLIIALQETYHACRVGTARISELVMSQLLANLISAAVLYLGAALYLHRFFNPLMLIVVVLVQTLLSVGWSISANRAYFKNRQPLRAVVFYGSEAALEQLCSSPNFREKYQLVKKVFNPEDDVEVICKHLEGCEIAFAVDVHSSLNNVIAKTCLQMDIRGYFAPRLGQIILTGAEFRNNFNVPMLRVARADGISEYRFFKRVFDFCASAVGIIVAAPIMLGVAFAIWMEDHGPVFYSQVRLTRNGRKFKILKFRSMTVNAEKDGVARLAGQNDSRITRVGRFIRACRLDELPQLLNILVGDMSIVGPRPERPEIAAQYEEILPEFALRLQVKAGLTGVAQVYGRYNTEPYHKLQMDLMYINDMSFLKDMQLILATIRILFVKESTQGVVQGQATAVDKKDNAEKSA